MCSVSLLLFLVSWDSLGPTELGLVENGFTGWVHVDNPYTGGRYILGPGQSFLRFPANQVGVVFSDNKTADAGPVECRTGRDLSDPDSGGQPVRVSVAFYYRIKAEDVGNVYGKFAMGYHSFFGRFAQQAVSDVVQHFHPTQFWLERERIQQEMEARVNKDIQ